MKNAKYYKNTKKNTFLTTPGQKLVKLAHFAILRLKCKKNSQFRVFFNYKSFFACYERV